MSAAERSEEPGRASRYRYGDERDDHIRKLVDEAPDLTPEQLDRLRAIMRPVLKGRV